MKLRSRCSSPFPSARLLDKPTTVATLLRQYSCCSLQNTVDDVTVLEVADMHIVLGRRYSEITVCCLYWEASAGRLSDKYFLTSIDASG